MHYLQIGMTGNHWQYSKMLQTLKGKKFLNQITILLVNQIIRQYQAGFSGPIIIAVMLRPKEKKVVLKNTTFYLYVGHAYQVSGESPEYAL